MVARSAMPLVVFTKYAEPHQGLNPSIQVTPRAALAGSPTRLLAAAVEQMRAAFFDFRIVSPVSPVRVAGWPAAHVRITYTLKTQSGQSSKVLGRIWLIPRGPLMFLVGMSGADVGDDLCEDEFVATLDSLEIHK